MIGISHGEEVGPFMVGDIIIEDNLVVLKVLKSNYLHFVMLYHH